MSKTDYIRSNRGYKATRISLAAVTVDEDVASIANLFKSENAGSDNFSETHGLRDGVRYNLRIKPEDGDLWVKFNDTDNDPVFIASGEILEVFNIETRNLYLSSAAATTAQIEEINYVDETGKKNVDTFTLEDFAGSDSGDYITMYDNTGAGWACYLNKTDAVAEESRFTFDTKSNTGNADYFKFSTVEGNTYGVSLDKLGTGVQPTAAAWEAIPKRFIVDISAATTAAQVATAVFDELELLLAAGDILDVTFANGTSTRLDVVGDTAGNPTAPARSNAAGSGNGSISLTVSTAGVDADAEPTGAVWSAIPAARRGVANCEGDTTATHICDSFRTALTAITGWAAKFTHSGTSTLIVTNDQVGAVTAAASYQADDTASDITVAQTTAGVASNHNNTYIKLFARDNFSAATTVCGLWYDVNGEGTQPVDSEVDSWHSVAIAAQDTDDTIAAAAEAVIDAISGVFTSNDVTGTLTITHVAAGPRIDAEDVNSPDAVSTTTDGAGDATVVSILVS